MDVTVSDCMVAAMSHLADADAEITQDIYQAFDVGYSELIDQLVKIGAPEVEREVYKTLPANTNTLFPTSLNVVDFSEPKQIFCRGGVSDMAITNVTDGTPITVTVNGGANPAPSGGRVELSGIPNVPTWMNRDWFISPTNTPGTFTLNGSIATGVGGTLATSGTVSFSNMDWQKVELADANPTYNAETPVSLLQTWRWNGGYITFAQVANIPVQLWIQYLADMTPPPTGTVGLLNGREKRFLGLATAAHFAPKLQMAVGPQLAGWAYGPSGEADGTGGALRELLIPLWKQKNAMPRRSGKFRIRSGLVAVV